MCCSREQSKQICGETTIKQIHEDTSLEHSLDLQQFATETEMVSLYAVAVDVLHFPLSSPDSPDLMQNVSLYSIPWHEIPLLYHMYLQILHRFVSFEPATC